MIWNKNSSKLLIRTINRDDLVQKELSKQNTSNYFESPFNVVNFSKMPYLLKDATLNSYTTKKYNFFAQFKNFNSTNAKLKVQTKEEGTNTFSKTLTKNNSLNHRIKVQKKILLSNSFINKKIKEENLYNERENDYEISSIRKKNKNNNIKIKKPKLNDNKYNVISYHNSMNHLLKNSNKNVKNQRNKNKYCSIFKTIDFPHSNINLNINEEMTFPRITQNKIFQRLEKKITGNINKNYDSFKSLNKSKSKNYVYNIKLQNKEIFKVDNVFNSINNSERRNKAIGNFILKTKNKTLTYSNVNFKFEKNNKIDNCYISSIE